MLAHPAVSRELDEDALPAYLSFGYVPTPRTFFRGVLSLPPGHVLTVEPGGEPRIDALLGAVAGATVSRTNNSMRRQPRARFGRGSRRRYESA